MPAKHIVKSYIAPGYYHIYNRGVEKRNIFLNEDDCIVFLHYLKLYLSPKNEILLLANTQPKLLRFLSLTLFAEVDLLAFALMPNHFHLEIKQMTEDGIVKLMRRLMTSYVMYFNRKYRRIGALFQNNYKAALVENDEYLLFLSRYIHRNPFGLQQENAFFKNFSSYPYFLGDRKASWIKPDEILQFFKRAQSQDLKDIFSYQSFVEDSRETDEEILGELILEED